MNRKEYSKLIINWKKNLLKENNELFIIPFNNNVSQMNIQNSIDTQINNSKLESMETKLGDLIIDLFYIRDQSHLFHWQTYSHALHSALGEFYEDYIEILDELIEMILGAYSTRPIVSNEKQICLCNFSENELTNFIDKSIKIIHNDAICLIDDSYTEIYNKLDEILELLDTLSYKVSLK